MRRHARRGLPLTTASATGASGWPRTLPLEVAGDGRGPHDLEEVRTAIEVERRTATRPVDVRVDAVEAVDPEACLWRLRVALPARKHLQRWEGAFLFTGLAFEGAPWAGEVVLADLAAGHLHVLCEPGVTPAPGVVAARPMDFLRAPWALLSNPRLAAALAPYARLLGLAEGRLEAPVGIHDESPLTPWQGHPAWTHGWAMVWGPPGTGKTHTLVHTVARLLER